VNIAEAIDTAEYRKLSRTLKKQYTINFSSRIFVTHRPGGSALSDQGDDEGILRNAASGPEGVGN